ncbi:hypothetical protein [Ehrlichia ruminantium]|nr:hypothetical protein [Ehrlichia ruminantium]
MKKRFSLISLEVVCFIDLQLLLYSIADNYLHGNFQTVVKVVIMVK